MQTSITKDMKHPLNPEDKVSTCTPVVAERPCFPHFTPEERSVIQTFFGVSPDAGWYGQIPAFTTKYTVRTPNGDGFKPLSSVVL